MANQIKKHLATQISKHLEKTVPYSNFIFPKKIKPQEFVLQLPIVDADMENTMNNISKKLVGVKDIKVDKFTLCSVASFLMDTEYFIENVIQEAINPVKNTSQPKKLIVEYSSPNIAKPFHVGHLRSTIIGNFIGNINEYYDDSVIRLNYLGDWGTQYGLLKMGLKLTNLSIEDLHNKPIESLYRAYVAANKMAETDVSIAIQAKQIFNQLEKGEVDDKEDWELYRKYTVNELKEVYERIGITFDEYHWESTYKAKTIEPIINDLEAKGVIKLDAEGKKVAMVSDKEVVVVKSDGSSLYLGRDIAAALDRSSKYNFDKMIYVVDGSQTGHFNSLLSILEQSGSPIASKCQHVRFGRIIGMSTRKGNAVFLRDILDEAKERMLKKQIESPTTKIDTTDETTSDILGTTAVIINDLKQKRRKNYSFHWDSVLQSQGDCGIRLQYNHCRLHNIEKNCNVNLPSKCIPILLLEPEALEVIHMLAIFDEVMEKARSEYEACVLVDYLFKLTRVLNRANDTLRVKNQSQGIAEQRLLLFHSARLVMKRGLEVLGIKVLNEM
ncbi:arginyl-tRNA synthetase, mitochondrial [Arctopsyche grandis]|uniref:arginyl-tRNA synthetase, mitochondrial n=1 Tax=Arctopsyche grandis TaxID=121162 RepID=UPI00406D7EFE